MKIKTVFLVVVLTSILISCSNSESDQVTFEQINPSDSVFSLDNLKTLGIKKVILKNMIILN